MVYLRDEVYPVEVLEMPYTVVGYSQDGGSLIVRNNQNEDLIVPAISIAWK